MCRVHIARREDRRGEAFGKWRLYESDGSLVCRWLPAEEPLSPLDAGGFHSRSDALGFKLAVDLIRSEAGLLKETPEDIEAERHELDRTRKVA